MPALALILLLFLSLATPATAQIPSLATSGAIGAPAEGSPIGGLDAGSITRTYRGDFGKHPVDQFSVRVKTEGGGVEARVLSVGHPNDGTLSWWNWDVTVRPGNRYFALFPKAWYQYTDLPVELTNVQYSPLIANNYKESSYLVGVFRWHAVNRSKRKLTVTLMFTWENRLESSAGNFNEYHEEKVPAGMMKGVVQSRSAGTGEFVLAVLESTGASATYHTRFDPKGDGGAVWKTFAIHGELTNQNDRTPAEKGERLASALAITFTLEPGAEHDIPFVLSWELRVVRKGRKAWAIAREAVVNHRDWERQIDAWQRRFIEDTRTPPWFKSALFDELRSLVSQEPDPLLTFAKSQLFPNLAKQETKPPDTADNPYVRAALMLRNGKPAEAWKAAEAAFRSGERRGVWAIQAALAASKRAAGRRTP